jgi:hypothetical protein
MRVSFPSRHGGILGEAVFMIVTLVGPPAPLVAVAISMIGDLLENRFGPADILHLTTTKNLRDQLGERRNEHAILYTDCPDARITTVLKRVAGPAFLLEVDPLSVAAHWRAQASQDMRAAARSTSAAFAALHDTVIGARFTDRIGENESRADLWGRFGRGLGLEPQEFDHDAWNAKLAPVASLELQHRDLDADLERAISPFRAIYHGGRVDEFHWPTSLFFGVDFRGTPTGESVADLVDLAGAARAIAYGPYLHLPSGTWMAVARFAISDIRCRNEIGAEVLMGSEVIASWYTRLPEEGEFELPMVFQVNEPREPVQIRISTLRGAIEGRFQLLHVTVSRVPDL